MNKSIQLFTLLFFLFNVELVNADTIEIDPLQITNELLVNVNGITIHPDRFTTLEGEQISSTQYANKAYNHEFFAISTHDNKTMNNKVIVVDRKGNKKYSFDNGPERFQISSDGEILYTYWEEMYGDGSYTLEIFKHGKLIFQKDSVFSFKFNKDKNILIYFRTNQLGELYYWNIPTNYKWNKSILNEKVYTGDISDGGEVFWLYTLSNYYGLNNKGTILWVRPYNFLNSNIDLSDHGKYLISNSNKELRLYSFEKLELVLAKKNIDITGNEYCGETRSLDERGLIFTGTLNTIKVYNLFGYKICELPLKIKLFFSVSEGNGYINIVDDFKKQYKIKLEKIVKE